jgi:hypothetical protein
VIKPPCGGSQIIAVDTVAADCPVPGSQAQLSFL